MSKQEWSELALVGGAAIYYGMSYGNYVAAGMPNLERFKRAVKSGEYAPRRKREAESPVLISGPAAKAVTKAVPKVKRIDRRGERKKLVCEECKDAFEAEIKAGPLPRFCPTCKERRLKEQRAASKARLRAKQTGTGKTQEEVYA